MYVKFTHAHSHPPPPPPTRIRQNTQEAICGDTLTPGDVFPLLQSETLMLRHFGRWKTPK